MCLSDALYFFLVVCCICSIHVYNFISNLFYSSSTYISNTLGLVRDYSVYKFRDAFTSVFESGETKFNDQTQVIELTYYKDSVKYKIAIPVKRGIRPIKTITFESDDTEENKKDIDIVKEFMGPHGNFHGIPTKPSMMGINRPLIITYRNNSVVKYEPEEIIELYPLKIIS
jgi:hypothetical protein